MGLVWVRMSGFAPAKGQARDGAFQEWPVSRARASIRSGKALVDQEIDAAHELGVVERGGGIGHVGQERSGQSRR